MNQPCFRAAVLSLVLAGAPVVSTVSAGQGPAGAPAEVGGLRSRTGTRQAPDEEPRRQFDRRAVEPMNAEATRQALTQVLAKHPPSVGRVLKMDPSLMRNEAYLAPYPELRDFLAEHEEIALNAGFYLGNIHYSEDNWLPPSPEQRITESILGWLAGFSAFLVVLGTLVWLIRTSLDHRRWNRLSKIQAEVHTKLMDRFSTNEELLTYVQTPSGRRFLESGPSPLQEMPPAMAAPFARILWSVQIGAVLLVTGLGLLFLSNRAVLEARQLFYIAGCLATAIGSGFVVSAAAAYFLSRRLGLLEPPAPPVQTNA
jgi:hypothetical protein